MTLRSATFNLSQAQAWLHSLAADDADRAEAEAAVVTYSQVVYVLECESGRVRCSYASATRDG